MRKNTNDCKRKKSRVDVRTDMLRRGRGDMNKVVPFPWDITMDTRNCNETRPNRVQLKRSRTSECATARRRVNYFQTISGYDRLIARYAIIGRRICENQSRPSQKDTVKRPLFARLSTRATTRGYIIAPIEKNRYKRGNLLGEPIYRFAPSYLAAGGIFSRQNRLTRRLKII